MQLSVLDLCPIVEGGDATRAFRESAALAQEAERLGFRRFWLASTTTWPGWRARRRRW
jgi:alkanesulfonate monooxygenase SsuD/methylene tetrahydromethanopterin reductase-like flavin-dependent oxidoreductase (luciferase family)